LFILHTKEIHQSSAPVPQKSTSSTFASNAVPDPAPPSTSWSSWSQPIPSAVVSSDTDTDAVLRNAEQAHIDTKASIAEGEALLYQLGGRESDGDAFMHEETGHLKRRISEDQESDEKRSDAYYDETDPNYKFL
jgi:hypothetical protein